MLRSLGNMCAMFVPSKTTYLPSLQIKLSAAGKSIHYQLFREVLHMNAVFRGMNSINHHTMPTLYLPFNSNFMGMMSNLSLIKGGYVVYAYIKGCRAQKWLSNAALKHHCMDASILFHFLFLILSFNIPTSLNSNFQL